MIHADGDLIPVVDEVGRSERNRALRTDFAQKVLKISARQIFEDDVKGIRVDATAEQTDDVVVRLHQAHQRHLGQQSVLCRFVRFCLDGFDGDVRPFVQFDDAEGDRAEYLA